MMLMRIDDHQLSKYWLFFDANGLKRGERLLDLWQIMLLAIHTMYDSWREEFYESPYHHHQFQPLHHCHPVMQLKDISAVVLSSSSPSFATYLIGVKMCVCTFPVLSITAVTLLRPLDPKGSTLHQQYCHRHQQQYDHHPY